MRLLRLALLPRYLPLTIAVVAAGLSAFLLWQHPGHAWYFGPTLALSGTLALIGIHDLVQTRHAILRNYPIAAHLRFFFEDIRPEMRQYFFEGDTDGTPFARDKRAVVYQRAKRQLDKRPFGTQYNVYDNRYEWLHHSIAPKEPAREPFRIVIGEGTCEQPYSASVLNISAMSYGALSENAIRALNKGARLGSFAHDTGEGGVSPYHKEFGGDLIWELGSAYFSCRSPEGRFSPQAFATVAASPQIKMIEVKLSQGAKPGHGGVLPGAKVTAEIAAIRGITEGQDCISPARHSAFSTPRELIAFLAQLRQLSGGKPVGFKLCVGHPWEFMSIVKAMLEMNEVPDFIVVDGKEGGTGAAPLEFMDHIGMPLRDGLAFVHATLTGAGLRPRIRIGASGKITTAFDLARTMALGADWCNVARGFMFAVGCIQAQQCHTDRCPSGVATQDRTRSRAIAVPEKAERVASYHKETLKSLAELIGAAGLTHPRELGPHHFLYRAAPDRTVTLHELYTFLAPGELLAGACTSESFKKNWAMARADSFDPAPAPAPASPPPAMS